MINKLHQTESREQNAEIRRLPTPPSFIPVIYILLLTNQYRMMIFIKRGFRLTSYRNDRYCVTELQPGYFSLEGPVNNTG